MKPEAITLHRRHFFATGLGAVSIAVTRLTASATPDTMRQAQIDLFGHRPVRDGRVSLKLPPIAENGFSVPLSVEVESPMSEADYVRQIAIFSPRNPLPDIARFQFTPASGRAAVSTRIRLNGTQTIHAIAEMSDGTLWSGAAETVVTLAACVVL